MRKALLAALLICSTSSLLAVQTVPANHSVLLRQYQEGEKLRYQMKGVNENWHYEIQADGIVKHDSAGAYFEEYGWSNLISDGQKTSLPPASADFRQQVTLDPKGVPAFPDLSKVDTRLIGPITDFMNFYADLWLAEKTGKLLNAGDHFYFKRGTPNSWADGSYTLVGEDSIDFDLTLKAIDAASNTATVIVRHVVPEKPEIKLPADWMRKPVGDTPNNFVQVQKTANGKYMASVGKETFDVELKVSLKDGKILSGTLHNIVETTERECTDAAVTSCGDPKPHSILRQIEIVLQP